MTIDRLSTDLAPLAAQLVELNAAIKTLTAEADRVKAEIRQLTPGPDAYAAGDFTITTTSNRRLNLDKIAENYPATEHPYLYNLTPDTKKVREHLPPDEVDRYMLTIGEDRVSVR